MILRTQREHDEARAAMRDFIAMILGLHDSTGVSIRDIVQAGVEADRIPAQFADLMTATCERARLAKGGTT